jgi:hypothetical protein
MTPSQYRAGGRVEEIRFAVGQTGLGAILVASSGKGVADHSLAMPISLITRPYFAS